MYKKAKFQLLNNQYIFAMVLLLWIDAMTKANSTKEDMSLGLTYRFRNLVYYCHDRKHGSMKADMVLER